jgi:hypothetical protein
MTILGAPRVSSLASFVKEGKRVVPADACAMYKISSPNTTSALTFNGGSHHDRFVGAEILSTHTGTGETPA